MCIRDRRTIDAFKTLTIALSDVGATKTWLDNGNLFNFEDINRWEQVALSYYTVFLAVSYTHLYYINHG